MKENRIRFLKMSAEAREIPQDLDDFVVLNDQSPKIIKEMKLTAETEQEADEWLKTKKTTCEKIKGGFGYLIESYAIEYYEADEDGEFIDGSNYETAERGVIA